jgi:hypothetical protein
VTVTAKQLRTYQRDPVQLIREQLVLENGQPFGDVMADFQEAFFRAVFATHTDGRPVHRLVYSERRRGESKTEDMAAVGVADLLVSQPARSYAIAGDSDQAELILDSVRGFQLRSPLLADLKVEKAVVTNQVTGSKLMVMSSDSPTSYGVRPRRVYFDELSLQSDERLWTSLWSAIGKNPRSQMIAVSMAGFDFSSLAWRIRELAASSPAYYFHTREGADLAPWLSKRDMEEQRATLHPVDFARLWDCRWTEAAGSWITREMYDACVTGQQAHRAALGQVSVGFVDVGLIHDPTAICVAHRVDESMVVDGIWTLQGSRSAPVELEVLEDLAVDLTQRFNVRSWMFEAPQAVATSQRLQRRLPGVGVQVRYPTGASMAQLFGTLYQLFNERRLVLFPHDQLRREALNLVVRVTGGRMKVVESTSIHQDHVVALGGCCDLLVTQAGTMITPAAMEKWKSLIEEMRSPAVVSTAYSDLISTPGVPRRGLDRLAG